VSKSRPLRLDLVQWLTGFLGAALVVAIVPQVGRFLLRRVVGKFLLETIAFAAVGVLLERGLSLIDRR
jgi:selenophosphate synthetase-related protein